MSAYKALTIQLLVVVRVLIHVKMLVWLLPRYVPKLLLMCTAATAMLSELTHWKLVHWNNNVVYLLSNALQQRKSADNNSS